MALDLMSLAISVVVNVVILSPVLWLSGRWLAGSDKAKFTDALWIAILGTVIQAIFGVILPNLGFLGVIIVLILWLALIGHFFDCGLLRALAISIVAVIILIVVLVVLGILGLTAAFFLFG